MAFNLISLHYLNTKEVQLLSLKIPEKQKFHIIKSDINKRAFGVLHHGCIISFHILSEYSKALGVDNKG